MMSFPTPVKIVLIDRDPIFRIGLKTGLLNFPNSEVVGEAETGEMGLELLSTLLPPTTESPLETSAVHMVIVDPFTGADATGETGWEFCRTVRSRYPFLRILLVTAWGEAELLQSIRQLGVAGFFQKGGSLASFHELLHKILADDTDWSQSPQSVSIPTVSPITQISPEFSSTDPSRDHEGLDLFQAGIARLEEQLQLPHLRELDRFILLGRRREMRAAQWVARKILPRENRQSKKPFTRLGGGWMNSQLDGITRNRGVGSFLTQSHSGLSTGFDKPVSLETVQSQLMETMLIQIEGGLMNQTESPLEIDILRPEKRQELFYLILRKLEDLLGELRFSQLSSVQLPLKRTQILTDLWHNTLCDFFGKYYTLQIDGYPYPSTSLPSRETQSIEVVPTLLRERLVIERIILERIPFVTELLSHLLFQTPLTVDHESYPFGHPIATERAELILQNLVIQVANGVIQPLLNCFANVEVMKQNFYHRRLLSTREIERFRNQLSWKYRIEYYIREPKAIFESCFWLLTTTGSGIKRYPIYAPRTTELIQLKDVRYVLTLVLEIRDAIAPGLQASLSFVGNGMVYLLTQVVGRGIGLIGRGILQGIGNSLTDLRPNRRR